MWLQQYERRMFCFVNQKIHHRFLDYFLGTITHLGGATATISFALMMALFAKGIWSLAGVESCVALALSHVPVAIIKKCYPRLRPYLVLPGAKTCKNPLTDHSFPSGHATAIFSVLLPFMLISPILTAILFPIASLVSISRIYLGLHYPSDCIIGSILGATAGFAAVAFLG